MKIMMDGKEADSASRMIDSSHPVNSTSKAIAAANLSIETGRKPTSAQQQLFSFPKPPSQRTPSSPLFHLCIDTDSRKGSSRLETPPSTADSSPSFDTFLQHRPSTSISRTDGGGIPSNTLMAIAPSNPRETSYPVPSTTLSRSSYRSQNHPKTKDHLDNPRSHQANLSPISKPEGTLELPQINQRIPAPKALSSRAATLFIFLRNDTLPPRIAVEGVLEWIEYWVNDGIRIRKLAEELEIVREEVSRRFPLPLLDKV